MIVGIDPGQKNLALCQIDDEKRIKNWIVISINPDAQGIYKGLKDIKFDDWIFENDTVAIERQPSKNPRAVRIQHYIEMFVASNGGDVYCIDPKHKLSYASTTSWWPSRDVNAWTYNERKKLSVETVAAFLADTEQDPEFVEMFQKSKKKDDLADALLHALAYLSIRHTLKTRSRATRNIKPVKPSAAHTKSGKYTQGGLKFLAKGILSSFDTFQVSAENIAGFCSSACRHFDTLDNAYVQLGGQ
jgi:hypothetical protein